MAAKVATGVMLLASQASGFSVMVDTNTWGAADLAYTATGAFRSAGSWSITVNSPGILDAQWSASMQGIGGLVISEDNPGSYAECKKVRRLGGKLDAAFHYHETGGEPYTMLTWSEIDTAAAQCGSNILTLTRAYWPNHPWRQGIEAVLGHPKLIGAVMEFPPADVGKRYEEDFVNNLLAHPGWKWPFFLLPFGQTPGETSEQVMARVINTLRQKGANLNDPRVVIVVASYGGGLPIRGSSNSIESAFKAALQLGGAPLGDAALSMAGPNATAPALVV